MYRVHRRDSMKNLRIEGTKSTPEIDFNAEKNRMIIEGQSYPENSFKFYDPIFQWIEEYIKTASEQNVLFEINLSYLNTSSAKSIMYILDILEEAYLAGKNIQINWYYDEENELSYEIAEDFMDTLEIPFNLISQNKIER